MSSATGAAGSETGSPVDLEPGEHLVAAVAAAETRLRPHLRETPVEPSSRFAGLAELDGFAGPAVWLKLENLQKTGSFKVRGALNALLGLGRESLGRGVVAASTGNHGAAVAFAAGIAGTDATVYVPSGTSPGKLAAIRRAGAEIVVHGRDGVEAELEARRVAADSGRTYVSPYNDPRVVVGQGTIGAELARQLDAFDALFVAVGGGGLVAGTAAYLKSLRPELRVVGCSPSASPVLDESVRRGRIVELPTAPTLSDGTAGGVEPGAITFAPCRELVDHWVRVTEEEIRRAVVEAIDAHHQLIEGAAGVALAGLVKSAAELGVERAVVVVCGGNISLDTLRAVLCETRASEGGKGDRDA